MNTPNVAGERLIVRLRAQAWEWYKSLQPNQRSYINASVFLALYLICKPFGWDMSKGFQVLAILFWGMAMIADLLSLYKKAAATVLGKVFFLGTFAFGANVALALSAQIVNGLIGVDPGSFVHTIAFTSLLIAPPLILVLSIVALFLGVAFLTVIFMFQALPDENSRLMMFPWYGGGEVVRYRGLTAFVQLVSLIAILSFAYEWSQGEETGYSEFVERKTKWFLYSFEMFEKAQCSLEGGQKVAFLNGDQVLVASKVGDEISFSVQECVAAVGKP